ncbi:hypothetical protein CLV56_1003 [Mumia flava]|uniref:Spermine/spermidine synthase n=1 Tax=Mumia flava TaxID=1348852 RepID=A0A0B2B768_9ACTN|nr:hypothetical protein [Mumia flava]PJJ56790.1 hypothetical protein CLV56_1003 [Mumia flava]
MGESRHEHGRAVLRRRDDGATELRVNGVFVMDDHETGSEQLLAESALAGAEGADLRVVVGGLGLGFTLRALLADPRVAHVTVAEIEPAVVAWMRDGTVPGADLLGDERVEVRVGDVRAVVAEQAVRSVDLILLDVDNGPDFLVDDDNAAVYVAAFLRTCAERLRARGELCVWSQADSPDLRDRLATVLDDVTAVRVPVVLQGRDEAYWLLKGRRPGTT